MQGKLKRTYRTSSELTRKADYIGEIPLAEMPRLQSLTLPLEGGVKVSFNFGFNLLKHAVIKGEYATQVVVECQRCLEPMTYTIDQSFELLIDAKDEEIESFQLDSVYTSEGYLDVFEVIEDELILALPIIMMHEDSSCNAYLQPEPVEEASVEKKDNPFAVLETLKGTN
jgi:uncharacterized protein